MPDNTVTLRITGRLSLRRFARALDRFHALVNGLSFVKRARLVEWIVADLAPGSAVATIEGIGDPEDIITVIDAYAEVGEALQRGERLVQYPKRVTKPAYALQEVVGDGVESVTFDTFHGDAVINTILGRPIPTTAPAAIPQQPLELSGETLVAPVVIAPKLYPPAYGMVSGQVETLARRNTIRFILYDTLHNKAVSCYVAEDRVELMRNIWGKTVTVEGLVSRDPVSGRPMSVRRITDILERPENRRSYRDARGASPYSAVSAEDLIRRVRDGW